MTKESKILVGLVALSSLLLLVLGSLFVRNTQPQALEPSGNTRLEVLGEKMHDWGQIDIEGGIVEKTFQVKNAGDSNLEITNVKTSCMCTEAQVNINGQTSPSFGMHTSSSWKGVIEPGQIADVSVVFDPLFHGPQGTGPITRFVSFDTNDTSNQTVEFKLSGNVVQVNN